jgi:ribosomal peptide maturation radical SAM protein 1
MSDVCLVFMPYGPVERPSLALGLLKQALVMDGISCEVLYPNFRFAERIGLVPYAELAWVREENIGEWTFSGAAFPDFQRDHDPYLERVASLFARHENEAEATRQWIWKVREMATEFVEEVAREIVARKPRILGCTTTFQQHCAVLALTRRVKELDPEIITVLGGANCESEMGMATLLEFPWVDCVASGEAEHTVAQLCRRLMAEGPKASKLPHGILGADHRALPDPYALVPRATAPLESCPVPDFDDFFQALAAYSRPEDIRPALMIETSRGCWWGAVKHCKFCGLNGGSMSYRFKPADRVLAELDELSARYGIKSFLVVDNILPLDYFDTLLPALAERGGPYHLFYEIKANLTYQQLQLLKAAGVTWMQPGIENFHDDALKLMDKGLPAWQCLQLLKWARELGITLTWNYLCGFPGEKDEWYSQVAEWIPAVSHLQPGRELRPIRYDRFSPYQQKPEQYGIKLKVNWAYHHIYPLPEEGLAKLVYIFHGEGEAALCSSPFRLRQVWANREFPSLGTPGRDALQNRLREWLDCFLSRLPCILSMTEHEDRTDILDTRPIAPARRVVLEGLAHRVHRQLHGALALKNIQQAVDNDGLGPVDPAELEATLQDLRQRQLVLKIGARYLALAVRGDIPALPKSNEQGYPGGWINRLTTQPSVKDGYLAVVAASS